MLYDGGGDCCICVCVHRFVWVVWQAFSYIGWHFAFKSTSRVDTTNKFRRRSHTHTYIHIYPQDRRYSISEQHRARWRRIVQLVCGVRWSFVDIKKNISVINPVLESVYRHSHCVFGTARYSNTIRTKQKCNNRKSLVNSCTRDLSLTLSEWNKKR